MIRTLWSTTTFNTALGLLTVLTWLSAAEESAAQIAATGSAVESGRLVVEGDAVFPYGVFVRELEGDGYVDRVQNVLVPNGLDLISTGWGRNPDDATRRQQYASVLNSLDAAGRLWIYDMFDPPLQDAAVADPVINQMVRDSRAAAAWFHSDDTQFNLRDGTLSEVQMREQNVQSDPRTSGRATLLSYGGSAAEIGGPDGVARVMAPLADIQAVQAYPVQSAQPRTANVFRSIEAARDGIAASSNPDAMTMAYLQSSGAEGAGGVNTVTPTPDEVRAMAWHAVNAGATGIGWYEFESDIEPRIDSATPAVFQAIVDTAAEIRQVEDLLLSPQDYEGQLFATDISHGRWIDQDGSELHVLVNGHRTNDYASVVFSPAELGITIDPALMEVQAALQGDTLRLAFDGTNFVGPLPRQGVEAFRVFSIVAVPEPGSVMALVTVVTLSGLRRRRVAEGRPA